jgi:hypothetical protein
VEIPSVSSDSFEFYEGLRIVLPGTFVVALYAAIGSTFGFVTDIGALPAIVGILVAGMLFFFIDFPSRATVFEFESPELVLQTWGNRPPSGGNHLNVYYEVLDTFMPAGIRVRTTYLGVIYRIGFEAVYLLSLPALAVLTLGELYPGTGMQDFHHPHTSRLILIASGAVIMVFFVRAFSVRCKEHGRKGAKTRAARVKQVFKSDLRVEVPWPDRLLLTVAVAIAIAYAFQFHLQNPRWGVAAIVITAAIWSVRYFWGVRRPKDEGNDAINPKTGTKLSFRIDPKTGTKLPQRRNLHGVSASLLFTVAALTSLGCELRKLPNNGPISTAACAGWAASLAAAAALIHFRSHERRLLGSYGLQRTWLLRNRKRIEKNYYEFSETSEDAEPPEPATPSVE